MATKFVNHLDLDQNELRSAVIERRTSPPPNPSEAQIYYDTDQHRYRLRLDSSWADLAYTGDLIEGLAGDDAISIGGTAVNPEITINPSSSSNRGTMSASDKSKLDAATPLSTPTTLVIRNASGGASFDRVDLVDLYGTGETYLNTAIVGSIDVGGTLSVVNGATFKDSVSFEGAITTLDGLTVGGALTIAGITSLSELQVDADATIGASLSVGGHVSVSGDTNLGSLQVGSLTTPATTVIHGDISISGNTTLNSNFVTTGRFRANADMDMDTRRIVNLAEPQLSGDAVNKAYVDALTSGGGGIGGGKYTADIGDGINNVITVNHNLNTRDLVCQVYKTTAPYGDTIPHIARTTLNSITLSFVSIPNIGDYRVVIQA